MMYGFNEDNKRILLKGFSDKGFKYELIGDDKYYLILGKYRIHIPDECVGMGGCAGSLIKHGCWELGVSRVIHDILLEKVGSGVFIDCGAHVGYYSFLASGLCKKVYSLECNPMFTESIKKSIRRNGISNIELFPFAGWNENGVVKELSMPIGSGGGGSIVRTVKNEFKKFNVECRRLDSLIADYVDLIKIDVEGAYEEVYIGMEGLLRINPKMKIVMEMSALHKEFCAYIEKEYKIFHIIGYNKIVEVKKIPGFSTYLLERK